MFKDATVIDDHKFWITLKFLVEYDIWPSEALDENKRTIFMHSEVNHSSKQKIIREWKSENNLILLLLRCSSSNPSLG